MSKKELIDAIAEQTGETKKAIGNVLDALSNVVVADLKAGAEVTLPGLGKLHAAKREARVGRNPRTGEPAAIAAAAVPKFKASLTLKNALNA